MTTAPLHWMSDDVSWWTPLDEDNCRFVIHREHLFSITRYWLERVQYNRANRFKREVIRQLHGIKDLDEAKRIAAEDWS